MYVEIEFDIESVLGSENKEEVNTDSEEDDGKAYSKMPHMT